MVLDKVDIGAELSQATGIKLSPGKSASSSNVNPKISDDLDDMRAQLMQLTGYNWK